ncbi:GNAT family N-acetyltransferase [Streptomyces litchfieldiae]|uniref:GNAT family N-acetyltransferase n=1 Tax=Streptomyces litchfieldiae TaxID=3075543 RepID=A0ABU2MMH2_9ACTN|nr:GNAT family N-acetyltransferase [Streptomyces sp. DSM 44938]MDT0342797.1 GNAT family N-acetyltransferase [Streptomyces sp. DSM 44938]
MTTITPINIRGYEPRDLDALRDICVRTAYIGGDATDRYEDPAVLPALFAEPYAVLDPSLVFVADDGERAIGYIVATADSTAYYAAFRERWLPTVADRFPAPAGPPQGPDEEMRYLLHHAELMLVPEIAAEYPAHLHIDLLPQGQRQGLGRQLMETLFAALRERGVPGVHLGMTPLNTNARAFYDRIGFTELTAADAGPTQYLGHRL